MKIVVIGGHVTPALALIDQLKKITDIDLHFIGRKYAMEGDDSPSWEYQLITEKKIPFYNLISGRWQRGWTRYTVFSLIKIPTGFVHSLWLVATIKPNIICSFGGYLSVPVCFWAWVLGIKIVCHEQTVVAGLSNRMVGLFATKVAISYPQSRKYFPENKVVLTGNPLRQSIFHTVAQSAIFKEFFAKNENLPLLYVSGGNQGSHFINTLLLNSLPRLVEKMAVIHQTGWQKKSADFTKALAIKRLLGSNTIERYLPVTFIGEEDIGGVFYKASLVIARAGANTVSELAALGKRSILIPLPHAAANEQYHNAAMLSSTGCAEVAQQKDLTPERLSQVIQDLLQQVDEGDCKQEMRKLVIEDAANNLAQLVYKTAFDILI